MKTNAFTRLKGMGVLAVGATVVQASFVNSATAAEAPTQQTVKFGVLDLSKSAGVTRLYQRIHAAAEAACGPQATTGSRLPSVAQQRCVDEAVDSAVMQLHNELLTAYRQQETRDQKETRHPGA